MGVVISSLSWRSLAAIFSGPLPLSPASRRSRSADNLSVHLTLNLANFKRMTHEIHRHHSRRAHTMLCMALWRGRQFWPDASNQRAQSGEPAASKSVLAASQVPDLVKQTLAAKFPAAKTPEWKQDRQHLRSGVALDGTSMAIKIDPAGHWLETESAVPASSIPQAVHDTLSRQFPGYKITETQTVELAASPAQYLRAAPPGSPKDNQSPVLRRSAVLNQSEKPKPA